MVLHDLKLTNHPKHPTIIHHPLSSKVHLSVPNGKCANRQMEPLAQAPRMWNLPRCELFEKINFSLSPCNLSKSVHTSCFNTSKAPAVGISAVILTHLGLLKDLRTHASFLTVSKRWQRPRHFAQTLAKACIYK